MTQLITEDQIRAHLEQFGCVGSIRLARDPRTGVSLGIAKIGFRPVPGAPHPRVAANNAIREGCNMRLCDSPLVIEINTQGKHQNIISFPKSHQHRLQKYSQAFGLYKIDIQSLSRKVQKGRRMNEEH